MSPTCLGDPVDVLEKILTKKKERLKEAKEKAPLSELEEKIKRSPPTLNFAAAIHKPPRITVIAELKMKSPSAGLLLEPYNVTEIAHAYERGGASALSVLTEEDHFGGRLEHIAQVRSASTLPILRKDFIFDTYQLAEARAFGADAVLLIADMLSPSLILELASCAQTYGLEPLVEVYSSGFLPAVINSGVRFIGINARNLRTLEMVPGNVYYMSRLVPRDRVIVAESGIQTAEDVKKLKPFRVSAVLVGESLMKNEDKEKAVHELVAAGQE
ncbi:MAG: indole-3-glycerol phosphate synthase TrpC [Elusimicrobia bacterium]|nr:indole-3-glycerol phosphate synthase TrpC [Candidatus Obscuribacterium magneticum]